MIVNGIPADIIAAEVGKLVQAVIPTMPLIVKGAAYPNQDVDEFIMYDFLRTEYVGTPATLEWQRFTFQLIAYSKPPQDRSDQKLFRHMELGNLYKSALQRQRVFYTMPIVGGKTTCIHIKEPTISFLDLRNLSEFSPEIQANTPPLHLLSAVLLFNGVTYYA